MGQRKAPVMTFDQAFKLTSGLTTAFMQQGMNKEVAEAMATKATETIGGDYQNAMGLGSAPGQADQLKAQDADFGKDGASATAEALNSNAADQTPASAQGLTTRYKMLGAESDKPFTEDQTDDLRMSKVASIYAKHGLLDKSTAIKDKLRAIRRENVSDTLAAEKSGWERDDRLAAQTKTAKELEAQQGASKIITDNIAAQEGSKDFATYQTDMASKVEGKGLDAYVRSQAGKDATPSEIDTAVGAFRQSMGDATAQHNAAGMDNLNKQLASMWAGIGNNPEKALGFLKAAESNGAPKMIEALENNQIDLANQLWNGQGNSKGDLVKRTIKDNKTGDMYAEVVNAYSGVTRTENVSAMKRALLSAMDVAKLRETESKREENIAQAGAARARSAESGANIGLIGAKKGEINDDRAYFQKTGFKPSTAGSDKLNINPKEIRDAFTTEETDKDTGEKTTVLDRAAQAKYYADVQANRRPGGKSPEDILVEHLSKQKTAAPKSATTDPNYRPWK